MPYKEMYLKLATATEEAIRLFIQAQQDTEELYLSQSESQLTVLSLGKTNPSE